MARAIEVQRFSYAELEALAQWPRKPFIVHSIPREQRSDFTIEDLERMFSGRDFEHWDNDMKGKQFEALKYLKGFKKGEKVPNLFQQYVPPEVRSSYKIPGAIIEDNIIFFESPEMEWLRLNLVMTPEGAYTGLHWDSYGYGGWMYLTCGTKHWELIDPKFLGLFWNAVDRKLYDDVDFPCMDSDLKDTQQSVPMYKGTLNNNEMLYFPPGWLHRVRTSKRSIGYGGSVLKHADIGLATDMWLTEVSLGVAMGFKYQDRELKVAKERFEKCLQAASGDEAAALRKKIEDVEKCVERCDSKMKSYDGTLSQYE